MLFGSWSTFPMDQMTPNPTRHKPRLLSIAGWVWIFLAIAALALGAGFALIPDVAAHVQL